MKYREPLFLIFLSLASLGSCQGGGRFGLNSKPFGPSLTSSTVNNGPYVNKAISDGDDGQYHPAPDEGQYYPSGDDGQYHPTDEGRYIPDNSGEYTGGYEDSGEGRYYPSNEGQYVPDYYGPNLAGSSGSGTAQYRPISGGQYKGNNNNYAAGTRSKISSSSSSVFPSSLSSKLGTDFTSPFQTRPVSSVPQASKSGSFKQPINSGIGRPSTLPVFPSTSSGRKPGLISGTISAIPSTPTFSGPSNKLSTFSSVPFDAKSVTGGKIPTFPSAGFEPKSGLDSLNRPGGKFPTFSPVPSGPKLDLGRPFTTPSFAPFGAKPSINRNIPAFTAGNGPSSNPATSHVPSESKSSGTVFPTYPESGRSNTRIPVTPISFAGPKPNFSGKLSPVPSGPSIRPSNTLPGIPSFSSGPKPELSGKTSIHSIEPGFGRPTSTLPVFSNINAVRKPQLDGKFLPFPTGVGITGSGKQLPTFPSVSPQPIFGGKTPTFFTADSSSGLNGKLPIFSPVPTAPKSDLRIKSLTIPTGLQTNSPYKPFIPFSAESPLSTFAKVSPSTDLLSGRISSLPTSPVFSPFGANKPSSSSISTFGPFTPKSELISGKVSSLPVGSATSRPNSNLFSAFSPISSVPTSDLLSGKISSFPTDSRIGSKIPVFSPVPSLPKSQPLGGKVSSPFSPFGTSGPSSSVSSFAAFAPKSELVSGKITSLSTGSLIGKPNSNPFSVFSSVPSVPTSDLISGKISSFPTDSTIGSKISTLSPVPSLAKSQLLGGKVLSPFSPLGTSRKSSSVSSFAPFAPKSELVSGKVSSLPAASVIGGPNTNPFSVFSSIPSVPTSDLLSGKISSFPTDSTICSKISTFPPVPCLAKSQPLGGKVLSPFSPLGTSRKSSSVSSFAPFAPKSELVSGKVSSLPAASVIGGPNTNPFSVFSSIPSVPTSDLLSGKISSFPTDSTIDSQISAFSPVPSLPKSQSLGDKVSSPFSRFETSRPSISVSSSLPFIPNAELVRASGEFEPFSSKLPTAFGIPSTPKSKLNENGLKFSTGSAVTGPVSKLPIPSSVYSVSTGPGVSSISRKTPTFPAAGITGSSSKLPTFSIVSQPNPSLSGKISTFPSVSAITGPSTKLSALPSTPTFGAPKPSVSGRTPVSGGQYRPSNEGQYKPDSSGGGSRGQYRPSAESQYTPDSSRNYGSSGPSTKFPSLPSSPLFGSAKPSVGGRTPVGGSQYRPSNEGQYKPNSSGGGQYRPSGDGQYKPSNFGNYGSGGGQYRPSSDGQYRHDDSGSYGGDGRYVPDDSGRYVHDDRKYEHQDVGGGAYKHQPDQGDKYRPDNYGGGEYIHQPDRGDKYRPDNSGGGEYKHQPDRGDKYRPDNSGGGEYKHQPDRGDKYRPDNSGGGKYTPSGPSNFGPQGGEKIGSGVCSYESLRNYKIIRQKGELHQDNYHYLYETENCMYGEERGQLHNKGKEDEVMRAEGIFYYVGPDKVKYTVTYTADENGFIPHGDHIPTPPPIPAAILRSLEYQKSLGEL